MRRFRQFVSLAALVIAASSFAPARRAEDRTPEAAYREYFAARMRLLPTVTAQSSLFDSLLADAPIRDEVVDEDDLGHRDWDAAGAGAIAEVESLWQGWEASLLRVVTTPQNSGVPAGNGTRLAVLLRQPLDRHSSTFIDDWKRVGHVDERCPPANWAVAMDVGTSVVERRILRAKRLVGSRSIDDTTTQRCLTAVKGWIQEEAVARWKENGWLMTPVHLQLALATTAGSIVVANFVEGDGEVTPDPATGKPPPPAAFFVGDRWLLLLIESGAGSESPVIRRIL